MTSPTLSCVKVFALSKTKFPAMKVPDSLDDLATLVHRLESAVTRLEDVDTQ